MLFNTADETQDKEGFTAGTGRSRLPAKITCHYCNDTSAVQVICISNIEGFFLERTVFPGQSLTFETFAEAVLEVRTGAFPSAVIADRISCLRLRAIATASTQVDPEPSYSPDYRLTTGRAGSAAENSAA